MPNSLRKSNPMEPLIEEKKRYELCLNDEVAWFVVLDGSNISCGFKLYQVRYLDENDRPLYLVKGSGDEAPWSEEKSEAIVTGFIKWDGCSEATYGRFHFCDDMVSYVQLHEAVLSALRLAHSFLDADWEPPPNVGLLYTARPIGV